MDLDISPVFGLLSWRLNQCGGVQERLSEIATPRYLAEGTNSKTVPWSMYLVWMVHLALAICRTWHLDRLKLMSHRGSHFSMVKRPFCRVIDSPSKLIARYMVVSSAKSLTLDLTWSGISWRKWRISWRNFPLFLPEKRQLIMEKNCFFFLYLQLTN